MSDRDQFGAFLAGLLLGGLSGAVVALLLTPQAGEETRAMLRDRSSELRDRGRTAYKDLRSRAQGTATAGLPGDITTEPPPPIGQTSGLPGDITSEPPPPTRQTS